ncbi:embryonic polarity protein dorsal-like, partial [Aedes albopictus]|uniref:RHD domain-containing protein n=1 Tax=Aedes albopictus TaxID=7160 RepID=A0ABM1Z993_AEDAL
CISTDVPQIVIIEQPQARSIRFRYACENRKGSFSPILGVSSSENHRSYPTVEIVGFQGRAKIVVHCVTVDTPPTHHPHKLVGHGGDYKDGVCVAYIGPETGMRFCLSNTGIQCVRKLQTREELQKRFLNYSNPYIAFPEDPAAINLNSLSLCFQAFLETKPDQFNYLLPPAISNVIYDKKSNPELKICHLSDSVAPANGGKKIILLCEKVDKNDIAIRFFKDIPPYTLWQAFGTFSIQDVHKQVAIVFLTPAYYDLFITAPVQVQVQLQQRSNGMISEPFEFSFHPVDNATPETGESSRTASYMTLSDNLSPQSSKRLPSFQSLQQQLHFSQSENRYSDAMKPLSVTQDRNPNGNQQRNVTDSDPYKFTIPMQNFRIQSRSNSRSEHEQGSSSDDTSNGGDSVNAEHSSDCDKTERDNLDYFPILTNPLESAETGSNVSLGNVLSPRDETSTSEEEQIEDFSDVEPILAQL